MEHHFAFEDLKVYQRALDFVDQVYKTTDKYPSEEKFSLTNQFRRAAVSISLNIAEGNGASNAENIRYAGIASRSLKECVVCTTISLRRAYIDKTQHDKLRGELAEIGKMLSGLIRYLSSKK
jgi:four helix bundle protein